MDNTGFDRAKAAADRQTRVAQESLDQIQRDKSAASRHTPEGVRQGVVDAAAGWSSPVPNPKG